MPLPSVFERGGRGHSLDSEDVGAVPSADRAGTGLPSGPSTRKPHGVGRLAGDASSSSGCRRRSHHACTAPAPLSHSPSTGCRTNGGDQACTLLPALEDPVGPRAPDCRPETARRGNASSEAGSGAGRLSDRSSAHAPARVDGAVSRSVTEDVAPRRPGAVGPVAFVDRHRRSLGPRVRPGRRLSAPGWGRSGRRSRRARAGEERAGREDGRSERPWRVWVSTHDPAADDAQELRWPSANVVSCGAGRMPTPVRHAWRAYPGEAGPGRSSRRRPEAGRHSRSGDVREPPPDLVAVGSSTSVNRTRAGEPRARVTGGRAPRRAQNR